MSILTDVIPAKARKYVYAAVTLAALIWGAFEASQGDWRVFTGSLITALVTATAASNTTPQEHDDNLRR